MAGGDAGRARVGLEIERDHDVRSCRNDRRADRTFTTHSRSAGPKRRVHGLHLLDVSASAHGFESEPTNRCGRIFADAGAVYDKRRATLEENPALTIACFSSKSRLSRASFYAARDSAS